MQTEMLAGTDTLGHLQRAPFVAADIWRRAQGQILGALGLGPDECDFQTIGGGCYWRLRDYGGRDHAPPLLIVAAPIKRPYIWDLAPSASAILHCLRHGQHVRLLEWLPASAETTDCGLEQYIDAIGECVARLSDGTHKVALMGHSLGGTLAAIFGAAAPESIGSLVLLSAPLCFRPATSRFRDALVSLVPSDFDDAAPCPGSLLSHVSAVASPDTFVWSRLADAAFSAADRHALEIHGRVERWALDEVPLPGRLVRQLIKWLYHENRFCQGELIVGGRMIGPHRLSAATLAVVNTTDEIAPIDSVKPFMDAMSTKDVRIIEYEGDVGVGLQHLGVLIGQRAHAQVWPEIISWIDAHR